MEKETYTARKKRTESRIEGKVPPQDIDLEGTLLGTVINYSQHLVLIEDLFKEEIFYAEAHRLIARAIVSLKDKRQAIDIMMVKTELTKQGNLEMIGGLYTLMQISEKALPPISIVDHVKALHQYYMSRSLITICMETAQLAYNGEMPFELLAETMGKLDKINRASTAQTHTHVSDLSTRAIKTRRENAGKIIKPGLTTSIRELDKAIGGFRGGQFIIIGARPAMGKTAVAIAVGNHISKIEKKPVAIFELEMVEGELYIRLQGMESGISTTKIRMNDLTPSEEQTLYDADCRLGDRDILIDDTAAINMSELRAKCFILMAKYELGAIIIDYIQLMKTIKQHFNSDAEITEISQGLKQLAKDLGIPVIGLAQLSRNVEQRGGGNIPRLSDLRNSGSLEQDADVVIFLHRPEYYKITEPFEYEGKQFFPNKLILLIIAKQRDGETKTIPALIDFSTMTFVDHPLLYGGTGDLFDSEDPF